MTSNNATSSSGTTCTTTKSSSSSSSSSSVGSTTGPVFTSYRLLYATQSGRAKACARRVERTLRFHAPALLPEAPTAALDDDDDDDETTTTTDTPGGGGGGGGGGYLTSVSSSTLLILFISTTGDGEPPDTMTNTWKQLLQRSLPATYLQHVSFLLFALGDRAYGPQFCATGRKLAVRLLQLGATLVPAAAATNTTTTTDGSTIGYGDDGTPSGGVLADLDTWMTDVLQPILMERGLWKTDIINTTTTTTTTTTTPAKDHPACSLKLTIPYRIHPISSTTITIADENNDLSHLDSFWEKQGPLTAYRYPTTTTTTSSSSTSAQQQQQQRNGPTQVPEKGQPIKRETLPYLIAKVVTNQRLTPDDWEQDTRHLRIVIEEEEEDKQLGILPAGDTNNELLLPYRAGDVVSILPVNAVKAVNRFLSLLPSTLQDMADTYVTLDHVPSQDDNDTTTHSFPLGVAYRHWPEIFTLRQWLTYCADFQALPEREDLWALSHYCNVTSHTLGADQRDKLRSLSDTSASALYTDYILRNKRSWADVLYDFDSLRTNDSTLTLPALVSLLAPLRPREFSIASSPTVEYAQNNTFAMDLTVA
eukprot:scaffold1465_cov179-Amphora_coffeaeformis.AAC.10